MKAAKLADAEEEAVKEIDFYSQCMVSKGTRVGCAGDTE